jgi:hypothetical protein
MILNLLKKWLRPALKDGASKSNYNVLEIDVAIKCFVSDKDKPFSVNFEVVNQGSFFTRNIFIENVDERIRSEFFYNYSALGMNTEELQKYGATDHAEYRFKTLEEAKKAKETTVQYIRYLMKEHRLEYEETQKIS